MEAAEDRPPYVTFETRPVEDRAASLEEGGFKYKDVIFALIHPMGSKDRIERVAAEWIEQNEIHVRDGRMPAEWLKAFKFALAEYKEGREIAPDGTDIKMVSAFTPAQVKSMQDAGIRTVEDMAAANDSCLDMIGMGGRMLKQRAAAWLEAEKGQGKLAGKLEKLAGEVAALQAINTSKDDKIASLEAALEAAKQEA
jgi:hypothetical protein